MSLEKTLLETVAILDRLNIRYAIMGGLAVRVYAVPRFTIDVDITISADHTRFDQLYTAFSENGFELPEPYRLGWLDKVAGLPLFKMKHYCEDNFIDVDVFVAETEFQKSIISRANYIESPSGKLSFVSPEDLILLKLLAARPKDLIDIQDILITMGKVDESYLQIWAKHLHVVAELKQALSEATE